MRFSPAGRCACVILPATNYSILDNAGTYRKLIVTWVTNLPS
jgi:hypothetical protein